jgi:DnaJ-class molecular chaperone
MTTVTETARCPKCGETNQLTLAIQAADYVLGGPGERTLPETVVCTRCGETLKVWVQESSDGVGGCLACRWVELRPATAVACPDCGGSGKLTAGRLRPHPGRPCARCSGQGWLPA